MHVITHELKLIWYCLSWSIVSLCTYEVNPSTFSTIMSSSPQSFLRQRNLTATPKAAPPSLPNESQSPEALGTSTRSKRDEVVWGKTPSGGRTFISDKGRLKNI